MLPFSLDPAPYQGDKVMILPLNQEDAGRTRRCLSFPTWVSTQMRQWVTDPPETLRARGPQQNPAAPEEEAEPGYSPPGHQRGCPN